MIFTGTQESVPVATSTASTPLCLRCARHRGGRLASISERRQERLVIQPTRIAAFLTRTAASNPLHDGPRHSAALVSEMKGLAHPACVTASHQRGQGRSREHGPSARKLLRRGCPEQCWPQARMASKPPHHRLALPSGSNR